MRHHMPGRRRRGSGFCNRSLQPLVSQCTLLFRVRCASEVEMVEDQVREDIAFIREAIDEGHAYAVHCGPDLVVWGVAVAIGHLGTYAFVRGWSPVQPNWLWAACIGLPWLYSLRS